MIIEEESKELKDLNETFIKVLPSAPESVLNSAFYPRIRILEIPEIMQYCREHTDLKNDLLAIATFIGEFLTEDQIRDIFDGLKNKYNTNDSLVGLEYHMEATRVDFGIVLFVAIKRNNFYIKKFIFRFRKALDVSMSGLSNIGVPEEPQIMSKIRQDEAKQMIDSLKKASEQFYSK